MKAAKLLHILVISFAFLCCWTSVAKDSQYNSLSSYEQALALQIYHNYKPPKLRCAELHGIRAIVSFLLRPDGQITFVRAVRESGNLKAIPLKKNAREFLIIERALVDAVKRSSPLTDPRPENITHDQATQVIFVYEPDTLPPVRISVLPLPYKK